MSVSEKRADTRTRKNAQRFGGTVKSCAVVAM